MEKFVAGDIVVIPFPYTDLSQFKRRPAIILKDLGNEDFLLAMITSKAYNYPYSLPNKLSTSWSRSCNQNHFKNLPKPF